MGDEKTSNDGGAKEKKPRPPRKRPHSDKQEFFTGDEIAPLFAMTEDALRRWTEREAKTQADGQSIAVLTGGIVAFQVRKGARWYYRRSKV